MCLILRFRLHLFIRTGDARPLAAVLEHNRLDRRGCLTARLLDLVREGLLPSTMPARRSPGTRYARGAHGRARESASWRAWKPQRLDQAPGSSSQLRRRCRRYDAAGTVPAARGSCVRRISRARRQRRSPSTMSIASGICPRRELLRCGALIPGIPPGIVRCSIDWRELNEKSATAEAGVRCSPDARRRVRSRTAPLRDNPSCSAEESRSRKDSRAVKSRPDTTHRTSRQPQGRDAGS